MVIELIKDKGREGGIPFKEEGSSGLEIMKDFMSREFKDREEVIPRERKGMKGRDKSLLKNILRIKGMLNSKNISFKPKFSILQSINKKGREVRASGFTFKKETLIIKDFKIFRLKGEGRAMNRIRADLKSGDKGMNGRRDDSKIRRRIITNVRVYMMNLHRRGRHLKRATNPINTKFKEEDNLMKINTKGVMFIKGMISREDIKEAKLLKV